MRENECGSGSTALLQATVQIIRARLFYLPECPSPAVLAPPGAGSSPPADRTAPRTAC